MSFRSLLQAIQGNQLLIGGHRGHLSQIRENTIANFEEVWKVGTPYIEIDVQLSADGVAVIYHDYDLSERTTLQGTIRDYTVDELKASFDLCTLEEAIIWCKAHRMGMMLEIKSINYNDNIERPLLAQQIIQAITSLQYQEECIPFSFDYHILRIIKQAIPETSIGLIVPTPPQDPVGLMKDMDAIVYLSYLKDIYPELVCTLHDAGFFVDGSVVNTEEELQKAINYHVDMIESDYPEKMSELLKGRGI